MSVIEINKILVILCTWLGFISLYLMFFLYLNGPYKHW